MRALEKKVFSYIREHQMLLPGERVVAGISGGADSVCLLFVLLEWRRSFGLELAVVHVNHGIRPEAGEDARFVEQLCRANDIPFYLKETNIPKLAKESRCSEEEAGRNYRYQVFSEVAQELGATKIAVAHNLNDRGETMLFHLFRGSGIKGLTGIAPVRDRIIRPLLCVERGEIEDYLAELGQDYCHDATNDGDDYARNRIRHHVLSYAEREIAPGCVQRMGQTADILGETEHYLEQQTEDAYQQCIRKEQKNCIVLDGAQLKAYHGAIRKRLFLDALNRLLPGIRDITYTHINKMDELLTGEGNRQIDLPGGIRVAREYDTITVNMGTDSASKEGPVVCPTVDFQVFSMEELSGNLSGNIENSLIFPQNQYTKWFDYDKIKKSPVIRTREAGDYLTIRDGQGGLCHKKLKDYMIESKIPPSKRDSIPLLAEDSHIIWAIGYRISEYYKVCENTKRVLQVQLIMNDNFTEEENG